MESAGVDADPVAPERALQPGLAYLVRQLQHVLKEELDNRLSPVGLTARQYITLSVLRSRSTLSNAQLARRCMVSPQSMSEVVTRLEGRELVTRVPHPAHGRKLLVALTEQGHAALRDCDTAAAELEELMLDGLDTAQRDCLVSGLRSCLRVLRADTGRM